MNKFLPWDINTGSREKEKAFWVITQNTLHTMLPFLSFQMWSCRFYILEEEEGGCSKMALSDAFLVFCIAAGMEKVTTKNIQFSKKQK